MDHLLKFHHIGIACRDIEKTKAFYTSMGYVAAPTVADPIQHVNVCFLEHADGPRMELLEPLDEQSPVTRTLAAVGVSPYHTCYEVEDIDNAIAALRQQRFILVNGPVNARALDDRRIAFMFNKNSGLIELVETR